RQTATSENSRIEACWQIASRYHGELAHQQSWFWLTAPREAAQRVALDALTELAAHYRDTDPHRRLQLLEHARQLDPANEAVYRDIMRTQATLGLTNAIPRTLQLLTSTLTALGTRPDPTTLSLARALQTQSHANPTRGR
ncbi:MAG: hypothetical protein ACRDQ1_13995, partial [Sciscionella sp.]